MLPVRRFPLTLLYSRHTFRRVLAHNTPMTIDLNRRDFLLRSCSSLTAVWVSAHWPALLSAATHARNAAQAPAAAKLEFFTADEAKEVDAITARIIPTDET